MVETARRPLTVGSPYKGLAPFTDKDAQYFFGRDRARRIISANLQSSRLTVLYGESGVGKSSLLRAGVVHHLRAQARRDLDELGTAGFVVVEYATWQGEPLPGLAAAIIASLEETFGHRPEIELSGDDRLEDWIKQISARLDVDLLFIFDQFEEYFVYHTADHPFIDQFSAAAERQDLRANFLVSIRDDRLAELDRLRTWIRGDMLYNRLKVEHLDVAAARLAIIEPVEEYNRHDVEPISVEPALVEAVIGQVKRGQVAIGEVPVATTDDARIETPYLQLVMSRLWEVETGAGSTVLRRDTLDELGGADRIVREHLDTALTALSPNEQSTAADLFRYLVTPAGSKIALGVGDLADFTGHDPQRVATVLRQLSEGGVRVLRTVPPPPGGTEARYEIFHDVLGPAITEWRARFDEQRNSVEARRELEDRVRASRRRALVFGAVAVAAIVAATAIVLVIRSEQREAEEAQLQTEYQLLVSDTRQATDPQDAMRSALAALELSRGPEAEEALRRAVSENRLAAIVDGHEDVVWSAVYSPDGSRVVTASRDGTASIADATDGTVLTSLVGHEDDVQSAVFTPDGERIVTAGTDGTARVWSVDGSPLATFDHRGPAAAAPGEPAYVWLASTDLYGPDGGYAATGAFSADGSLLVTAFESSAWIWDLDTGELVEELEHPVPVYSAAFSPDGARVVTAGSDGLVRIWDPGDGTDTADVIETFGDDYDRRTWFSVSVAMFDPAGERILAGHDDGTVTLWQSGSEAPLMDTFGHTESVEIVGFSFDGSEFLTSGDRTLRVWDTSDEVLISDYAASTWISDASFSPDGLTVVVAEGDGTARIVSTASGDTLATLQGHGSIVWSAAFSPDGSTAVTSSEDGTARLWTVPTGLVVESDVRTMNVATFDPTGGRVITVEENVATVRDTTTGEVSLPITAPGDSYYPYNDVIWAAFDTTGNRIITTQKEAVTLWDAETEDSLETCCYTGLITWAADFVQGDDAVAVAYSDNSIRLWRPDNDGWKQVHKFADTLAFADSGDGTTFATVDRDGTTWVWDAATMEDVHSWDTGLVSLALSDDGTVLVTAGVDGGINVWDASTGDVLVTMRSAGASSVALGADDSLIVSGGADGSASVWRLTDGAYLGSANAQANSITTVEMSVDGLIATSSFDGTARVFSCDVCSASLDEVIEMAEEALVEPAG